MSIARGEQETIIRRDVEGGEARRVFQKMNSLMVATTGK